MNKRSIILYLFIINRINYMSVTVHNILFWYFRWVSLSGIQFHSILFRFFSVLLLLFFWSVIFYCCYHHQSFMLQVFVFFFCHCVFISFMWPPHIHERFTQRQHQRYTSSIKSYSCANSPINAMNNRKKNSSIRNQIAKNILTINVWFIIADTSCVLFFSCHGRFNVICC